LVFLIDKGQVHHDAIEHVVAARLNGDPSVLIDALEVWDILVLVASRSYWLCVDDAPTAFVQDFAHVSIVVVVVRLIDAHVPVEEGCEDRCDNLRVRWQAMIHYDILGALIRGLRIEELLVTWFNLIVVEAIGVLGELSHPHNHICLTPYVLLRYLVDRPEYSL